MYAESYWELSRRVYLDTRFELDIDVDADNDSTKMLYVDGGLSSFAAPGPGDTDQRAVWDSFIRRDSTATNESWYFDFLVDVPAEDEGDYLGYVSYDVYEVRIFEDGYELWNTSGTPAMIDSYAASTAGRRNIGIRAGEGDGVWVDGTEIMQGPSLTTNQPVMVGFGTHLLLIDETTLAPGLALLENLNYVKAWQVGPEPGPVPSGGPAVTITNFDGPRPVTVRMPIVGSPTTSYAKVEYTEDGTRADIVPESGETETQIFLPNGRRMTAVVCAASCDLVTYDEGRNVLLEGNELPGAKMAMHVDAMGTITPFEKASISAMVSLPFNVPTSSNDYGPWYFLRGISVLFGPSEPVTTQTAMVSAFAAGASGALDIDVSALETVNCDNGECACRYADPTRPTSSVGMLDIYSGTSVDYAGGNGVDLKNGIMFNGDGLDENFKPTGEIDESVIETDRPNPINQGPNNGTALGSWNESGGAEWEEFELIGGQRVRYLKAKFSGRYFRHVRTVGDDTYWPHPGMDGYEDYVVPQEVIDRLNQVKRGGICLPKGITDVIDGFGSLFGLNDEVGLALMAYAVGQYGSDEERESVLDEIKLQISMVAGLYLAGAIGAGMAGPGGPAVIGATILAAKAILRALFKKLRKYVKSGWVANKLDDALFAGCNKLDEIMKVRGKTTVQVRDDLGWKGHKVKPASEFTRESLEKMGYDKRFLQEMAKNYRSHRNFATNTDLQGRANQLDELADLFD